MDDDGPEAWFHRFQARLAAQQDEHPNLHQAAALSGAAAGQIVRLLSGGWTLDRLEAAIARSRTAEPQRAAPWLALSVIHRLAHIPADEFDAWSALYGHNYNHLNDGNAVQDIDIWRAAVPGPIAPHCAAIGLGIEEAKQMHVDGTLDENVLRGLADLRQPIGG